MENKTRVYLENDLELLITEFNKHIHILIFSHYDWSIINYQILEKTEGYIPSWTKRDLF